MSDIIEYLKKQYDTNNPVYDCLRESLKAFDTGLLLMFLYGQQDLEYSREHGDLPEGAMPLEIALRHSMLSTHTGGVFAEPWYIAQRLRDVAAKLDAIGIEHYESGLRKARLATYETTMTETRIQQLPVLRERASIIRHAIAAYDAEWNGERQAGPLKQILSAAMDTGLQVPTVEDDKQLWDLFPDLGTMMNQHLTFLDASIARNESLALEVDDDPDGFASPVGMDAGQVAVGEGMPEYHDAPSAADDLPPAEEEEEKGLFDR